MIPKKEYEIVVSGGKVIFPETLPDGKYLFSVTHVPEGYRFTEDGNFIFLDLANLSEDDEFMKYEPTHQHEKEFKEEFLKELKKGFKNIWRSRYDVITTEYNTIDIIPGEKARVPFGFPGICPIWWWQVAKKFNPQLILLQ